MNSYKKDLLYREIEKLAGENVAIEVATTLLPFYSIAEVGCVDLRPSHEIDTGALAAALRLCLKENRFRGIEYHSLAQLHKEKWGESEDEWCARHGLVVNTKHTELHDAWIAADDWWLMPQKVQIALERALIPVADLTVAQTVDHVMPMLKDEPFETCLISHMQATYEMLIHAYAHAMAIGAEEVGCKLAQLLHFLPQVIIIGESKKTPGIWKILTK